MGQSSKHQSLRFLIGTLLFVTAAIVPQSIKASLGPSGLSPYNLSAIYTKMILAMKQQASPEAIAYDETFMPHGLGIRIVAGEHGGRSAQLVFSTDLKPRTFQVTQSASGETDVYDIASGIHYSQTRMFWEATWSTVHPSVMSEGAASGGRPGADSAVDAARQRVIADVMVMSDKFYRVSGGEVENLDGASAYHLRFAARDDKVAHPLTDVYIDTRSFLVLKTVAAFKNEALISGDTGTITLNFRRIGSFWMVKSGQVTARAHVLFTHAAGTASFALSNVTFPSQTNSGP